MQYHLVHLDWRQNVTFSLKGLKTITNYQYEPACGILSLLDIFWEVFLLNLTMRLLFVLYILLTCVVRCARVQVRGIL